MRENHITQLSLHHQATGSHPWVGILNIISQAIDRCPDVIEAVGRDMGRSSHLGRPGLPAESVLRCAVLMRLNDWTYKELTYQIEDSQAGQRFARYPGKSPSESTLQSLISRISAQTWDQLSLDIIAQATSQRLENVNKVRIDSTVTETTIAPPRDSEMLRQAVELMQRFAERAPFAVTWPNRNRRAKKRSREIGHCRGQDKRKRLYQDLLGVVVERRDAFEVLLADQRSFDPVWAVECDHYLGLIDRLIDQTQRRVIKGEKVPADQKLLSLFEDHTDVIVKGNRGSEFGHKLNLTTGAHGMVLDMVIERGNPADSARLIPMLERHQERFGKAPHAIAADAGYTSKANVSDAKAMGVEQVALHQKRGTSIEDMTSSRWVYLQLKRFRAGVEGCISYLKRSFGLSRCRWKGWGHFCQYVQSAVAAYNLLAFARLSIP